MALAFNLAGTNDAFITFIIIVVVVVVVVVVIVILLLGSVILWWRLQGLFIGESGKIESLSLIPIIINNYMYMYMYPCSMYTCILLQLFY